MSDEKTEGAPAPEAQKSSSEQMIPKSRFDELVAQKRDAQQQAQMMQQMVQTMANSSRPQQKKKEDPTLRKLREEHPDIYAIVQKQQQELETVRGSSAQMAEHLDRQEFFSSAGKNASKYEQKVEEVIRAERANGNYNVKRSAVYAYIRGQEAIQKDMSPEPKEEYRPSTQNAHEAVQEAVNDAPSSNPQRVAPKGTSTAALSGEESREERVKKLEDVIF